MRKHGLWCVLLAALIALFPVVSFAGTESYEFVGQDSTVISGNVAIGIEPCARICIAASGQQILFRAIWSEDDYEDFRYMNPTVNNDITYRWTVSDTSILKDVRQTQLSSSDDEPEMIGIHGYIGPDADRIIGTCAEPGHVDVYCEAYNGDTLLPVFDYTGMMVLALNASPVPDGKLGDSFQLQSYWCSSREQTYEEAKEEIPSGIGKQYGGFWLGLDEEWQVVSFTDAGGHEFMGQEAQAAAGPVARISGTENDGTTYGNLSSVTPTQAGTYVFECIPSVGSVPAQVTVRVADPSQTPGELGTEQRVPGDCTGDGKVTIADLVRVAKAVSGATSPDAAMLAAADFNGNGRIDLTDLVRVAAILTAGSLVPEEPTDPMQNVSLETVASAAMILGAVDGPGRVLTPENATRIAENFAYYMGTLRREETIYYADMDGWLLPINAANIASPLREIMDACYFRDDVLHIPEAEFVALCRLLFGDDLQIDFPQIAAEINQPSYYGISHSNYELQVEPHPFGGCENIRYEDAEAYPHSNSTVYKFGIINESGDSRYLNHMEMRLYPDEKSPLGFVVDHVRQRWTDTYEAGAADNPTVEMISPTV